MPLFGTGARYGLSVSIKILSFGINLKVSCKSIEFLKVIIPLPEKYEFKLQWLDELSKMVELYISNYQDIIVAGDFNVLEHKNDVKDFENWNLDAL